MGKPITIEAYASMRAELEEGTLRDEVLARAELSVEEWTQTQRDWLEKMGAELDCGRFELTNRYGQAFLERQQALTVASRASIAESATATPALDPQPIGAPAPPLANAPWAMPSASPPQAPPVSPVDSRASAAPLPVSVPTGTVDEPESAAPVTESVPPEAAMGRTAFGVVLPRDKALPFDGAKAISVPPPMKASEDEAAAPVTEATLLDAAPGGTVFGVNLPLDGALPFDDGRGSSKPPPTQASEDEPDDAPAVTESALLDADPGATVFGVVLPRDKALPFDGAKASSEPPPTGASDPPKPGQGPGELGQTLPVGQRSPLAATLPVATADERRGLAGGTAPKLDFEPGAATPFEAPATPDAGQSAPPGAAEPARTSSSSPPSVQTPSLKQLAAVLVELSFAADEAQVLRRYGLTKESKRAAFTALEKRCREDAAIRAAWIEACSVYREWRAKQGGR